MNRYNIGKISQSLSFHFLASWQTELCRRSSGGKFLLRSRLMLAPSLGPALPPEVRGRMLGPVHGLAALSRAGLMLVLTVGILEWIQLELSQMSNERFPPYLRHCRVRCFSCKVRRNDLGWGRSGAEKTGEMIRTREVQEFHRASHISPSDEGTAIGIIKHLGEVTLETLFPIPLYVCVSVYVFHTFCLLGTFSFIVHGENLPTRRVRNMKR